MPTPFEISDALTEQWADLAPIDATSYGIAGRDHLCTDYSPDGHLARTELFRSALEQLDNAAGMDHEVERFAARVLSDWLRENVSDYERGQWRRDLNHIESPFQNMRDVFDVMPRTTSDDWEAITSRLRGFGGMLVGYRRSLEEGVANDETVAIRQARSVLEQARSAASEESRFLAFPEDARRTGVDADSVASAVDEARAACDAFAAWLERAYLPACRDEDAVGREEYLHGADHFLGMRIDPEETYEWGWEEVHRIRAEMETTAADIDPNASIGEVIDLLDNDPARSAASREEFVEFVSNIQHQAIGQLSGEHFDVPDELKVVTVNIAPPGGSLGAWYMAPSEDFTRAGSIWYAPGERERIPYWQEVSTAYHEGFPGHHLQVGTAVFQRDKLSRLHRAVIWNAGSGEGWALYAERLMDELGFFEKPEYRLGLLASQLFRSVRVVLDIGCQLGLKIPDHAPIHEGELWSYETGVDYMNLIGLQPRDVSESEVTRYLGWWGQAISYKVGEREILAIRDEAQSRPGFDRKDFHRRMLEAGGIRLDHLREVMV